MCKCDGDGVDGDSGGCVSVVVCYIHVVDVVMYDGDVVVVFVVADAGVCGVDVACPAVLRDEGGCVVGADMYVGYDVGDDCVVDVSVDVLIDVTGTATDGGVGSCTGIGMKVFVFQVVLFVLM